MKRKEERSWTPKSVAQGIIGLVLMIWFLWFIGWSNSIAMGSGYDRKPTTTTTTTTVYQDTTTTMPSEATTTTVAEETTTTVAGTTTTVEEQEPVCVDPNTAVLNDLLLVKGVDNALGMVIITTSTFDGPFLDVQDLVDRISGIGDVNVQEMLVPDLPDHPGYFGEECWTVPQEATTTTSTTMPSEATTTTVVATTTTVDPSSTLPMTGGREIGLGVAAGCVLIGSGALVLLLWDKKKRQEEQSYLDFDE